MNAKEHFRPVKCSDRLPELKDREQGVGDWVLCYWKDTDDWGETFYDYGNEMWDGNNDPEFWLEPYELPTEEEIDGAIELLLSAYLTLIDENGRDGSWPQRHIAKRSFEEKKQAITNLLKGE